MEMRLGKFDTTSLFTIGEKQENPASLFFVSSFVKKNGKTKPEIEYCQQAIRYNDGKPDQDNGRVKTIFRFHTMDIHFHSMALVDY
jgi:hypothetical protein